MLLGCVILGVGVWIRVDENLRKYVNDSNHFDLLYTGVYIFIVVGILIMIAGFLGCCGAIRENQCMLGLFFALLFVIFCIFLGAGIWAVVAKDAVTFLIITPEVKHTVNKALQQGVDGYFVENSPEREFMDLVQNDFECCGATKGGEDYPSGYVAKVEACNRYTRPCNEQLFKFMTEHLVIYASVMITMEVILVLGMIFSMVLLCALRDAQMD